MNRDWSIRRRARSGFTLIELLVVIAVIAVLIALLLPAVQSARESARRIQCVSNLKQIALAFQSYHDVHNVFPPGKKGCCWGTWLVSILPYVEQSAMYNAWNHHGNNSPGLPTGYDFDLRYFGAANRTVTSTRMNLYLCPSDQFNAPISETMDGKTYACTSQNYAANFGNTVQVQTDFQGIAFGGAPFVDIGSPLGDHSMPARRPIGMSSIIDGTSATLAASEVIVGQGIDLRGFSWWGDAAGFEAYRLARQLRSAESASLGRERGLLRRQRPLRQGFDPGPGLAGAEHDAGRGDDQRRLVLTDRAIRATLPTVWPLESRRDRVRYMLRRAVGFRMVGPASSFRFRW
jgi:prepilin-type N-terminal cleavage/methylation domain-containing protein